MTHIEDAHIEDVHWGRILRTHIVDAHRGQDVHKGRTFRTHIEDTHIEDTH